MKAIIPAVCSGLLLGSGLHPVQSLAQMDSPAPRSRAMQPHQGYVGLGGLYRLFHLGYRYHLTPQFSAGAYLGPNLWGAGLIGGPTLRFYVTPARQTFYLEGTLQAQFSATRLSLELGTVLLGYEFHSVDAGVFNLAAGADIMMVAGILPTLNLSYGWAF
jgi:hypothetical protein